MQKRLLAIYNAAAVEAANIGALVENFNSDELFRFADFPITHDRIRKLMQDLSIAVERTIANGIDIEWALANEKNDELCDKVFGNINLSPRDKRRYYKNNADAREAFKLRKQNGLGLSERVWEYTDGYKDELEKGLSLALGKGKNAQQMAKELQGYLRNPDKLFRRVRDKYGILKLSQPASKYHPGRGVYRSSYKNALRLAVTETNMAYRASDHARYQQLDFIVGQEVHISQTNHPVTDICDELKGRYPKDFKFVGWHPFCRCYVTSVLKSESEFLSDLNNGTNNPSRNAVTDVPGAFKKWVENNADRIEAADAKGTSPYFIRDNKDAVNDILRKKKQEENKSKSPLQIAEERHVARTTEHIEEVYKKWDTRRLINALEEAADMDIANDSTFVDLANLLVEELRIDTHNSFVKDFEMLRKAIDEAKEVEYMRTERLMQSAAFAAENKALEKIFGKRGMAMPFKPANEMRGNPHYLDGKPYQVNCQTCVVANEMRRRGFNVEALGNVKGSALEALSRHTESIWLDAAGNIPESIVVGAQRYLYTNKHTGRQWTKWEKTVPNRKRLVQALENNITEDGRYHIQWDWKEESGHIITMDRINGVIRYYDPQDGSIIIDIVGYIKDIDLSHGIKWLRVDNLHVNTDIAQKVLTKSGAKAITGTAAEGGLLSLRKEALQNGKFDTSTEIKTYKNLKTTKLHLGKKPLTRILNHCKSNEEIDAVEFIWNNPGKLSNPRISPLGENKDMTLERNIKNIANKQKRGVIEYIEYEFEYNGEIWTLKTEHHRAGFEQFYHVCKKNRLPT